MRIVWLKAGRKMSTLEKDTAPGLFQEELSALIWKKKMFERSKHVKNYTNHRRWRFTTNQQESIIVGHLKAALCNL